MVRLAGLHTELFVSGRLMGHALRDHKQVAPGFILIRPCCAARRAEAMTQARHEASCRTGATQNYFEPCRTRAVFFLRASVDP